MQNRDLVVIGGSAGAIESVKWILHEVPRDLPAAVAIVLHVDPTSSHLIPERIARESALPVEVVDTQRALATGRVYFPPPDHHLVVNRDCVHATHGPHENLWRPAIDVLFRSAAVAYGSRVMAVLLSGNLDDGTAGLAAVKECGGTTIIQNPQEAKAPSMPQTAAASVEIDHCVSVERIASLLVELSNTAAPPSRPVPPRLLAEVSFAEPLHRVENPAELSAPSIFSCLECGGPLWEYADGGPRFRCLVGHSYRNQSLLSAAAIESERTLWAAVRLFEQRMHLERRIATEEAAKGRDLRARIYRERSDESERHAIKLRELLKHAQAEA